jgi:hypothetical protein
MNPARRFPSEVAMKPFSARIRILAAAGLLIAFGPAHAERGDIAIIVDGIPLDARAIAVKDEVYVPAWILENYAHTKVNWMRSGNILEILTEAPGGSSAPQEGKMRIKVGIYFEQEGFVVGKGTRLYLINGDPKEFRFSDGKTPAERAHEGTIERLGSLSEAMRGYLRLPPTERFAPKGWKIVSRMPAEEISGLSSTVDRYELLYKSLYYDLVTNLVNEKEQQLHSSSVVDDTLKGVRIEALPVGDDGSAEITVSNGLYFLYARMLHKNRQIVWDIPVALRGGETFVELSNRNAALFQ